MSGSLRERVRELGISPGILPTGRWNSITDVHGVRVGQVTLLEGDDIRTGVTAILPHDGNLFRDKVPAGIAVGRQLGQYYLKDQLEDASADGSIMIVLATDAPLSDRNLKRVAKRGLAGLARTGASMSNGSGDYVIAVSTAKAVRRTEERRSKVWAYPDVPNDLISPLFQAAIEATEEAIYNSLCMAETMTGYRERTVNQLPLEKATELIRKLKPDQ